MPVVSKDPLLVVENLSLTLPTDSDRDLAVRDLSFSIRGGETLCLVGESGSGKSMTALAIMGLLPQSIKRAGGTIHFQGENLLELSYDEMRRVRGRAISMIFQEPMTSLNPVMTIGDQISEMFIGSSALTRRQRIKRTLELLDEVGLPSPAEIIRSYPHQLSGGQRQRVMIAMALALEPKLIIADEPTTALDVTTQAQILKLIKVLQDKHGTAVLFITHDLGVVADIADHVSVLRNGSCVESGTVDAVLRFPSHEYTQRLLSAVPSLVPPVRRKASNPEIALAVKGLTKVYGGKHLTSRDRQVRAVDDVSLEVRRGETLGLVGESGSGKSTVSRCIMQLVKPDSGEILVMNTSLNGITQQALQTLRRRIQMVFQDPFASLNPRHTVGRIIAEGPVAHGTPREDAVKTACSLLQRVGLKADAVHRYPHEFSGGQRQRIGIARALALQPDVLIADEPVSALDVSVQAQILQLLDDLQDQLNLAILFVTHDLRVAAQMCDRIAVMKAGRILETAPTECIISSPRNDYTKALFAAVPGFSTLAQPIWSGRG